MEIVIRKKQPKSAVEYYVRLYCLKKLRRQKNGCKLTMKNLKYEATISWANLNSKKKQLITTKFKSQQLKLQKCIAEKLRGVTPKSTVRCGDASLINSISPDVTRESTDNTSDNHRTNSIIVDNEDISNFNDNGCEIMSIENNTIIPNVSKSFVSESEKQENILPDSQLPVLCLEPSSPAFKTSKELYDLLNKDTENALPWAQLTRGIKCQYERAATKIRRDYIQAYSSYLESLSHTELYTHYKEVTEDKAV